MAANNANGNENSDGVKLKVGEIPPNAQEDIGSGVVRIGANVMEELGVREGDAVLIRGDRETVARVARAYPADAGLNIIRMDGYVRKNAGTSLRETVAVEAAELQEADRIVLAPAEEGVTIQVSSPSIFRRTLHGRAVTSGDIIVPSSGRERRRSMFEDMFDLDDFFDFTFGETKLMVVDSAPDGPVAITENTEIEVEPQAVEQADEIGPRVPEVTYEDIGGLEQEIQKVREMIELPLKHPEVFQQLGIDAPSGVLLYGPPGTGKTLLAKAVANEADAWFTSINGPEIMSKYYGESEKQLREIFDEARENAPGIIFIDEIDSIAPKRGEARGEVERRVVAQLLSLMDGLEAREDVIVIAATNRHDDVDEALRRPGRLDREIEIGVPDRNGRKEILQIHTRNMPLADDVDLDDLANHTHGYVGADLEAVAKEAAMTTLRRVLPEIDLDDRQLDEDLLDKLVVNGDDFTNAVRIVEPSAMREVLVEVPKVSWDDVGGLDDVKDRLEEMVDWPLSRPDAFEDMGITAPNGLLLYGLPGTGKTLLAKAVANESDANFISIKGPELFSKWVGESEKAIRQIFSKARQVAPAIIFIDEVDSLAHRRGSDAGSGVGDRVLNQLLSELDGIEDMDGVVVIGATNRPDIIDPALLRPGRLDRHLHVPVPGEDARRKIFEIHTAEIPLADDVDIDALVRETGNYVGADIEHICREAAMKAMRADAGDVTMAHFQEAIEETKPSATEEDVDGFQDRVQQMEAGDTAEAADYFA